MWHILLLAVVQGLTEFLPVSSSGHLVILQSLVGVKCPGFYVEVALHGGTLLSILIFYRTRIAEILLGLVRGDRAARNYAIAVFVATVPVVLVYLSCRNMIESIFDRPHAVFVFLAVTGVALLSLRLSRVRVSTATLAASGSPPHVTWISGLWIGAAQAAAMLPGISRSGATIVTARHLGMQPQHAAEFSMLIAIPALTGAIVVTFFRLPGVDGGDTRLFSLVTGIVLAALVGYVALRLLVQILHVKRFWLFGIYCLGVAAAGLMGWMSASDMQP